jgi:hypothetical protein
MMQPNNCGRFCKSCEKTVVDFSGKTDDEIIAVMTQSAVIPCGRFSDGQLNRPILASKINTSSYPLSKIAAFFLLIQTTATAALAQQRKEIPLTHTVHSADTDGNQQLILEGSIKDYLDEDVRKYYDDYRKSRTKNESYGTTGIADYKDRLVNMELSITGSDYKTNSDQDGHFKFILPLSLKGKELVIQAAYQTGSSLERPHSKIRSITVKFDSNVNHLMVEVLRYDSQSLEPVKIEGYNIYSRSTIEGLPVVRFQNTSLTFAQKIKRIFKKKRS